MMMKFMPQTFNDFLYMVLVGTIMALWILSGLKVLEPAFRCYWGPDCHLDDPDPVLFQEEERIHSDVVVVLTRVRIKNST
jgi:hypothetical protein